MFKNSKNYMPTYILVAINIAVYGFTSYLSGNAIEMSDQVLVQFGQYNPYVFNGEVWRLFTGMFVHANIAHIVGNMLFLFIYGLRAEDMFDIKEYLLIYFMSGLAGGLLTLFLWPDILSVGASGAIFGMIGATMVYLRRAIGQSIINRFDVRFLPVRVQFWPKRQLSRASWRSSRRLTDWLRFGCDAETAPTSELPI